MIDINELKTGDLLTICENGQKFTVEFMERSRLHSGRILGYDLSNPQYVLSHISKESINDYCTSWKRDGVELLKQEEEKPLYVFCPIEKNQFGFFMIIMDQLHNGEKRVYPLDDGIHIGSAVKDGKGNSTYTFIGYSDHEIENLIYESHDKPIQYVYEDDGVEVKFYPFAVFMLTSKLHVGGE